MAKEVEITKPLQIFNDKKKGINYGYSKQFNFIYNRKRLPRKILGLKEWDFYQIQNEQYVLQLTIGHLSYVSSVAATLIDLKEKKKYCFNHYRLFHNKKKMRMELDGSKEHYLRYDANNCHMLFDVNNHHERYLSFDGSSKLFKNFDVEIRLIETSPYESLSIHTPFLENKKLFFLNYKLNSMRASGMVRVNQKEIHFSNEDSFAVLDWGRGYWPRKTKWYWANATGIGCKKELIGFNLGFGFGDLRYATENMFFVNGKAYKIKKITLSENVQKNYMIPHQIIDEDMRLFLKVTPEYDHYTQTKNIFGVMEVHQVFSTFSGFYLLEDGSKIEFNQIHAFFEFANNNW